jgi:hypothetical protein
VLDLPLTPESGVEVDGRRHSGEPLGPGVHRIVASSVRVADPAAVSAAAG